MASKIFTLGKWRLVNKLNKELLDDFVLELKSNKKSKYTIEQYIADARMILVHILDCFDNKYILDLTKKDFRKIKMWLIDERQVSAARCCRVMAVIHSMLDYAEDDDDYDYDYNKSKKVKGLTKNPVREIIFLTDEQITRLRNHLKEEKKYKLMFLVDFYYDTGARRREVFQVQKDNLLERNYTNIVRGKRGKMFPLIYFSRSKESLRLYLDSREDALNDLWICCRGEHVRAAKYNSLYVFTMQIRKILSKLEGRDIPITPHSFRHSCIQNLQNGTHYVCKELNRQKGFTLQEIKYLVHHESVGMTESYLKDNTNDMIHQIFGVKIA